MAVTRLKMDLQFVWLHNLVTQNFGANDTFRLGHRVLNDAYETNLEGGFIVRILRGRRSANRKQQCI